MQHIEFIHADGRRERVEAHAGESAMEAAMRHGIADILAECGGNAVCATCHVYVDDAWLGRLPAMAGDEDGLLDGTAAERRAGSRLSCQVEITPDLDGLALHLPDRQV